MEAQMISFIREEDLLLTEIGVDCMLRNYVDDLRKLSVFRGVLVLLIEILHQPLELSVHEGLAHKVLVTVFGDKLARNIFIPLPHFNCKLYY
jgi:hypothetical protein